MPPRVRLTKADVRRHAARKRPALGAEPSWPPKRPQVAPSSEPAVAGAELDRERIITLSVSTVPIEAPSEERSAEEAAPSKGRTVEESVEDVPVAQPAEEVRAEAREPKQPASAVAHLREGPSRAQVCPPFLMSGPGCPHEGRPRWHLATTGGRPATEHRPTPHFSKERRPWPTTTWPGGYARWLSSQPILRS